ncbi:three-Cys-motif partner protein TcmP [Thalassospira sp. MCCC 1A01428]|uniref:three-Cys-motif partner protein TcmP n=1 Tax=Thalassospira sp. MCCC 1A01428 TaxID=1470575 RepID=UPI000A1FF106|nr:three-Cys-motif partner protein TcmP [Thalassospira sp. MCCC 1A01428]OSQ34435.1 hypothetical protein THS27_25435 [Thalassospira sp. MCCC 1A01428]
MPKNFMWKSGRPLPRIESHTLRKLEVLKNYLDVYFDTVVSTPASDCLNITLVDGFAGGGAYQNGEGVADGSPLVLLNAVNRARERLNQNRKKPLEINARFFFIDDNKYHIEALRERLWQEGFGSQIGHGIEIIHGKFSEKLPDILSYIKLGQRAGRSIFLLDQFGYLDAPMESINLIFSNLKRPEVLLTFAIDGLLNYLQETSSELEKFRQFGITDQFISEWNANKDDESLGRLVTQRTLMANIQMRSGSEFFTPFMLWSPTDKRWMMFVHLSRHQAARDKMLGVHWSEQNYFKHIGPGSIFSLGFDVRLIETKDSLFSFADQDKAIMNDQLLENLPLEIRRYMTGGKLPVNVLLKNIANRTAATNNDLFEGLMNLARYREIDIFSKEEKIKRPGSKVDLSDTLAIPPQLTLFTPF